MQQVVLIQNGTKAWGLIPSTPDTQQHTGKQAGYSEMPL